MREKSSRGLRQGGFGLEISGWACPGSSQALELTCKKPLTAQK